MNNEWVDHAVCKKFLLASPYSIQELRNWRILGAYQCVKLGNFVVPKFGPGIPYKWDGERSEAEKRKREEKEEEEEEEEVQGAEGRNRLFGEDAHPMQEEDPQALDPATEMRPPPDRAFCLPAGNRSKWREEEIAILHLDEANPITAYQLYKQDCMRKKIAVRTKNAFHQKR